MIRGIIYLYKSPSNKYYVGQTYDEEHRRKTFLSKRKRYCSGKNSPIDNARIKYGPENFEYKILEEIEAETLDELKLRLDNMEIYYINKYDSFKNGYNCTVGGKGIRGYKWREESREKMRGKNNPRYKGFRKKYIKKGLKHKPVEVFDLLGNKINRFDSVKEAAKFYNLKSTNIVKVCKGKLRTTGKLMFKYENE